MFTRPAPALPTSGCLPNRAGPRPQRGQSLNDGAVDFARRLDQSQSHSDVGLPTLGFEDGDRLIACSDLPLQILRDTPRNTNLDNSRANVSVRFGVFAHLQ